MVKRYIIMLIGAALFLNGAFLCFTANIETGVLLTTALGLMLLLYGFFCKRAAGGVMKIAKYIVTALLCAECVLTGMIAIYGTNDNVTYDEDAVIVLGAAVHGERVTLPLQFRLDKAIEYHEKNPDAVIVVTGGKGTQEAVTEASAMEKYLAANGVDLDKIIKEERATSTNENMRFSKLLLDEYFDGSYKTVVITNNFHIYRGVSVAKREGFSEVSHMHAKIRWYNLIPCYIRESLAVLKLWIIG